MKKFINLTPHDVNLVMESGTISIPKSGEIARVGATTETIGEIDGIPVVRTTFNPAEVTGLPEPQDEVIFITSTLVAQAVAGIRDDVLVPANLVRDENGVIIGAAALQRL